ncbi:glycosyl hydrolase family 65 protein [Streptomyces sp. NPDC005648]|uniref:MGH1-like glycoside hydrolase domain-containing protein n=1 Tax=Streptomyces sp. NPDC005648 TaxID=3157044 RepID=UPI0033B7B372
MQVERRTRRGRLARRSFLAAVAAVATASARATARGSGYAMPTLAFADPAVQRDLGTLYATALRALADRHTVPADPAVYDRAGLLSYPPGTVVRAGGGYPAPQRWTRDAAVNAWGGVSLLAPAVGRNTLWSVVERGPRGPVVQQDDQWWDQVVWIPAAWHHYRVTGDRAFLARAHRTALNTLAARRARDFDPVYGLFRGPGFMNDGISGYPSPPASPLVRSSFVLDHPGAESLMCLSTNCLHHAAHSALADMADRLGEPERAKTLRAEAEELREAIDRHLWREEAGTYAYLLHGDGTVDASQEGAGLALAVLCGVADRGRARRILDGAHWQPYGIVNVWPHFPRFDDERPGRHNVMVWPMVHGLYGNAAASAGRTDLFGRCVELLAALVTGSGGDFHELYDSLTGAVDGGWQEGGGERMEHFVSQPDQTWSATAYLRLMHDGLFGLDFAEDALRLRPCLPPRWGPVSLRGLRWRRMTLDIALTGGGGRVRACTVDGRPAEPVIRADGTGHHTVDLVLEV